MKTWRVVTTVVVAGLALWFILAGPVLLHFTLGPFLQDRVVVLNPIRDRTPERLARQMITQIHSPSCTQVLGTIPNLQAKSGAICEKQAREPLRKGCPLSDRKDHQDMSWVSFNCGYEGGPPDGAFVSLTFVKRDKSFVLQDYERIY